MRQSRLEAAEISLATPAMHQSRAIHRAVAGQPGNHDITRKLAQLMPAQAVSYTNYHELTLKFLINLEFISKLLEDTAMFPKFLLLNH